MCWAYHFSTPSHKKIQFRTVTPLSNRCKGNLLTSINDSIALYMHHRLTVCNIHCDGKFECLRPNLRTICLNVCAPNSHVGEVEYCI